MKDKPHSYYPVYLNVEDRRCIVVGGGMVALRKVQALLDFGAYIIVISPWLCAGMKKLLQDRKIEVLHRIFQPGDLKGATLAIAATASRTTNAQVAAEGRRSNVPVNAVDDHANCDFILPSYLRRGGITVAVSTSGMSPALARKIRSRLEKVMGKEYEALAVLVEEVRRQLKKEHTRISSARWQQALDIDLLTELVRKGRRVQAKTVLLNRLKNVPGEYPIP